MSATPYSDLKVAWDLDRLAELRDTGRTTPSQIQLVISDLCNNDCTFCAYRMSGYSSNQHFGEIGPHGFTNNPNRLIPFAKAIEILDDARSLGVGGIQFTGGGEPTVHPQHLAIFDHALGLGLKAALVTNANRLADGWQGVLPSFSWIRASIDAGTAETYTAIRKVPLTRFDVALANVSALAAQIERAGSACYLGTSFIVTKENYREIAQAARRVKETGARSIRFAAIFSPEMSSYYEGIREECLSQVATAISDIQDSSFRVIDMLGQRMGDLARGKPDYRKCHYQQLNVYIGGDQKAYRCCNTAYNDLGDLGSMKNRRLTEWFYDPKTTESYVNFNPKACDHCAFNGKNEILGYLCDDTPDHAEFV